jgi:carboxyl-terminal processing protease
MKDFVNVFNGLNDMVSKHYCHFETKNINPLDLYSKYIGLIKGCDNAIDFKKNVLKYFAELRNDHSMIFYEKYGIFCMAKLIEKKVFIDEIYKKELYANFHEKDEIIEIDNVSVMEWINKNKKYISASTESSLIARTVTSIFYDYFENKRKYLIKSNNEFHEIIIDLKKIDEMELYGLYVKENVKSEILEENIGYIALNSMMGNVEEFENEYFKIRHLPYLIIDVRRNHGGKSDLSEKIAAYLIKDSKEACVSRKVIEPNKNNYKGKLILLIDVTTASAAESFILDIKESESGIIIGTPTSGDTGHGPQIYTLSDGIKFNIPTRKFPQESPKGFPMEGIGIPPDYYITTNIDDYLNNVDSILKYAIKKIKRRGI